MSFKKPVNILISRSLKSKADDDKIEFGQNNSFFKFRRNVRFILLLHFFFTLASARRGGNARAQDLNRESTNGPPELSLEQLFNI